VAATFFLLVVKSTLPSNSQRLNLNIYLVQIGVVVGAVLSCYTESMYQQARQRTRDYPSPIPCCPVVPGMDLRGGEGQTYLLGSANILDGSEVFSQQEEPSQSIWEAEAE
jgi:hypothetical protein